MSEASRPHRTVILRRVQFEIGTDRRRVDSRGVAGKLRVLLADIFIACTPRIYTVGASISGTKIFLGGSVETEPMQRLHGGRSPSAISTARLRLIGDTGRTAAVHFHCHREI